MAMIPISIISTVRAQSWQGRDLPPYVQEHHLDLLGVTGLQIGYLMSVSLLVETLFA